MERPSGLEIPAIPEAVPWEYRKNEMPMLNRDSEMPEAVPWQYRGNEIHAAENKTELGNTSRQLFVGRSARRKCGMPIQVFYGVLALVVLVIIGGIAGGVAGGLTSASRSQDNQSLGTTPTVPPTARPNTHVSATSKLSATNWTNPVDGTIHRFIFFQDPFNAMIVRRWNSTNGIWSTNNLTDIFSRTKNPVNVLTPSTPLASVSSSWSDQNELHIYYVAPNDVMTGAAIKDLVNEPDTWVYDDLAGATLTTFPGSQIAAAWQRGYTSDSPGWWAIAWQDKENGAIRLANATDFHNTQLAIPSVETVHRTGLALIPERYYNNDLNRLTMVSESLLSPTMGVIRKFTYRDFWFADGRWLKNRTIPPPTTGVQFSLMRSDNWAIIYLLVLLPNGTITGEYYEGGFEQVPVVTFVDGPSDLNFTAIAATEGGMVYGISGDSVLEYSVNNSDPSVLQFEGTVFP
ncbi:hypothetical protein GGR58DRAFT_523291 [Xylaria digitata]|nr:hypothetical protein GGR58DRAFT_523291 [Xylaria digitata]